ncbi:uncharacterized protein [Chironomus tepperi]|uniref:uncharacterized protein n=1 Tax=Chironomus tepperi TaxID=113505 RepID=UPI00391F0F5F
MSNNSEYFPQASSFATSQSTIKSNLVNNNQLSDESSSEASLQVSVSANSSPDSEYRFSFVSKSYEVQNMSFRNEFTMEVYPEVDQNYEIIAELSEEDLQKLIKDLEGSIINPVIDENIHGINVHETTKNYENLIRLSANHEYKENQKCSLTYGNSTNSDHLISNQIPCQNQTLSNMKASSQHTSLGPNRRDCREIDTQAELEFIDQILESLCDDRNTDYPRSYSTESDTNITLMSIFD